MPSLRTALRTTFLGFTLSAVLAAISLPVGDNAAMARVRGCRASDMPVCGVRADGPKSYGNACLARADGARMVHPGQCEPLLCGGIGVLDSHPMCGRDPLNHQMITYPNKCAAEHAAANWLYDGPCRPGRHRR